MCKSREDRLAEEIQKLIGSMNRQFNVVILMLNKPDLNIMDLPNELYLRIFSFLGKKDVKSMRSTCKLFSELANIILFSYPDMEKKLQVKAADASTNYLSQ